MRKEAASGGRPLILVLGVMYQVSAFSSRYLISICLMVAAVGASAEQQITIKLDDARISELSLALGAQTGYRIGMPREVQGMSGISVNVVDAPLSELLRVLEEEYGLCTWIWQPPEGYEGPNLNEIRWAYCEDPNPKGFANFVRLEARDDA